MGKRSRGEIPKTLSHDSAKTLLEEQGWVATVGGKHSTKMEKRGERPITLPRHRGADYGAGLRAAILRQAGLTGQSEDLKGEVTDADEASNAGRE